MNRPLTASAEAEEELEWQVASRRRKAWAKCRSSWQASETEDLSTEATTQDEDEDDEEDLPGAKLPAAAGRGNVPNEKIAIWLKDCRTPLGASLDEQSGGALKGVLGRNGGSFEDDLSLGAEANHLHEPDAQVENCNNILAKERRLQFHQKGRSMNSTGSGKSSGTVSSVSELLELYEEDPEEILYNLGFGRDEPDIASKIPSRFFSSSSFARGIDIKVFLSAQMQRMEVENPNYALTSRFRQIEVLTTVANAFSSLYSQVSGTPLQRIGSMSSVTSTKEATDSPPPLTRSNTANRLMKTLSKLNLCVDKTEKGEGSPSPSSEKGKALSVSLAEDSAGKNDPKLQKVMKKKESSSTLATVTEEVSGSSSTITDSLETDRLSDDADSNISHKMESEGSKETLSQEDKLLPKSGVTGSDLGCDVNVPSHCESESSSELRSAHASTGDKEPCAPLSIPFIRNIMTQQKDSFEMEEVQSTEGEAPHVPATCQLGLAKSKRDHLLRTASQHSDSSGFAEDSADCLSLNHLQVHESLQAMGSSADSCDSETTVTSLGEDHVTPTVPDQPYFNESEEESRAPVEKGKAKVAAVVADKRNTDSQDSPQGETAENTESKESPRDPGDPENAAVEEAGELPREGSEDSDVERGSGYEFPQYTTHHILKSLASIEAQCSTVSSEKKTGFPSSVERVNTALQRAQMKVCNLSAQRVGRSLIKSKDLLKQRYLLAKAGYPLRRSQSLPTTLLSPVRVVSSVNVRLSPGKETRCSPPSFTYKYTPEEEQELEKQVTEHDGQSVVKSTIFIPPSSVKKEEAPQSEATRPEECPHGRLPPCPQFAPISQSTCSLHSAHEWQDSTCEKMVRSQSFSHSIQNSFLPPSSITRSHSFNRAVDLTKPYQNQQLPVRVPLRSGMLTRNSRQSEVLNGNEHLGFGFNRPYAAGAKKLALSNGPGVSSTLGYRMVHPSLLKSSRPPFSGTVTVDSNKNSPADMCVEEEAIVLAKDGSTDKDHELVENESYRTDNDQTVKHDSKMRYLSDDVDDISLSSLSSSDKNDLSEDFSDDFIDLEDSNRTRITPEEITLKEDKHENGPSKDRFDSPKENEQTLSKTDEWIDISVSDRSECAKHTSGNNLVSPDTDYRAGSSFELSPSDSSDGTYMWDEEGLEPIGSVHPVGSYESSEMNSIDILNNLESCDLEDDDLMLDVDLPEDTPLDNVDCDNMNRFDRADRNVRQSQDGFWKRAPQRWSGQEHYHLSHPDHYHHHGKSDLSRGSPYRESPLGHFESYGGTPFFQAQKMFVDVPDNTVILDEMTLRHMVQDCTAVKTQLLKLKRLLHQHDGSGSLHDVELSLPSSPEPEDGDQIYKNEDLLNEIKQLKEDIKKKDEKIQLLEHRLATRCNCHQKSKEEKCTYADKYTQTPWRRLPPQVLQPSSSLPRSTDHAQGKLIKPQHTEAHSEHIVQGMCQDGVHPDGSFTHGLQQENSYDLEDHPLSPSSQFTVDVVKGIPSETNLSMTMNAQEPYHLAKNQTSDMQFVPTPPQTPSQSSTVDQTKRVGRNQSPQLKSKHLKPSILSSLAHPDSDSSPRRTSTYKKSPVIAPCNSKHQPMSNQNNLANNLNLKTSKLRPPSGTLKQKQISNSQLEPQNFQAKTSIPRPLARPKELQNPHSSLHSGDCVASNRYSRLPKPKIH